MANLQPQIEAFDRKIRLGSFEENAVLREKRDRLLSDLSKGLKANFKARRLLLPQFETFNQGSYAMRTGIKPINGEYDIDVGLVFEISIRDYRNPVEVKTWVFDALSKGARDVRMRRSCVTVTYMENGRTTHHVDLAIYGKNRLGQLHLARGVTNSAKDHRHWEPAAPFELIRLVQEYRDGAEREQFRRVIRLMKRWRDICFPNEGNAAPVGIGLTVLALRGFKPIFCKTLDGRVVPDDLTAVQKFVKWMLGRFKMVLFEGVVVDRLPADLPVEPYSNVLLRMTNRQMGEFEKKLETLRDLLAEASAEADLRSACKKVQEVFGSDFPLPKVR